MTPAEFDQKYLGHLNPQQQEAVHTVDGAVLLLAVPGSGKTTVLITRLGYMVLTQNIAPQNILTMTYTTAATKEMQQRFSSLFGAQYAVRFHTINSLSNQIIRTYAEMKGRPVPFQLADGEITGRIIRQVCQSINHEFPTDSTVKDVRTGITYIKNRMLSGSEIDDVDCGTDNIRKIYESYCQIMNEENLIDFDDQMINALKILKGSPAVLSFFQEQFPYICVDESQDTSKIQHEIISLLASKSGNLFMVGDEDQSIYGFRAAYPEALLHFEQEHPGAKVLLMEQNYRSTREIIAAANAFVSKNRFRHPKSMIPTRGSGCAVQKIEAVSREAQYLYLFEIAKVCREETAILYRNNDSALPLIDLFQRNSIPYNCKKFDDAFFTHRIINDITDIILFASDPANAELFMRIYYKMGCAIGKKAAEYACNESRRSGKSILEALQSSPDLGSYARDMARDFLHIFPRLPQLTAQEGLREIWTGLNYSSYVNTCGMDAGKYDILLMLAKQESTLQDLLRRLQQLRQILQQHQNRDDIPLTLSTVHSSKGLEYRSVYLLDVFDGILPSMKLSDTKSADDTRHYEEDRRVYYVAMTRAKEQLHLFTCKDRDSSFTSELLHSLPKEFSDKQNVFFPLSQNLCSKTYVHKDWGKGKILAHEESMVLVRYESGDMQLASLFQLYEQRCHSAVTQNSPAESPKEEELKALTAGYTPGSRIHHQNFGDGVILSVTNGIAKVKFDTLEKPKQLLLEICLKQGILR